MIQRGISQSKSTTHNFETIVSDSVLQSQKTFSRFVDFWCRRWLCNLKQSCRNWGLITEIQSYDGTTGFLPLASRPRGFCFQPSSSSFSCSIERIWMSWMAAWFNPWVPGANRLHFLLLLKQLGGRHHLLGDVGPRLGSHGIDKAILKNIDIKYLYR